MSFTACYNNGMEISPKIESGKRFELPHEEIEFLHKNVESRERMHEARGETMNRDDVASRELSVYRAISPHDVLAEGYRMDTREIEEVVLKLSPDHKGKVDELIAILETKGIRNALSVAEHLGNPHIEDDFHRFLVQYVLAGGVIADLKEKTPLSRVLHMKLFEVTLPAINNEGNERKFSELVSAMNQFYAGMLSISEGMGHGQLKNHFTLEIANSNFNEEVIFYVSVPSTKEDLFKKHIISVYPNAHIEEHREDYNPFNEKGKTAAAHAILARSEALPLRTYKEFDHDPVETILNIFSKIKKEGEGAAIQVVFMPTGEGYNKLYKMALEKVKKGEKLKDALQSPLAEIGKGFLSLAKEIVIGNPKNKKSDEKHIDESTVRLIEQKISFPILETNIRIIASADTLPRAEALVSDLASVFNQFGNSQGNSIAWKHVKPGKLSHFLSNFTFRNFSPDEKLPLSIEELTTMFHFPVSAISVPHLKEAKGGVAPAPISMSSEGIILGVNHYRGNETKVHFAREDRLRHFYAIGQTGTGKTTLLKNMIAQDIQNGDGVCMIDPHGTDIEDVLSIIPKERIDDVIYFDPAHMERPMGLNMLEIDNRYPEQKTFVVNEMLSIFSKLFDMKVAGGPMFEQYFRNATMLVIEDPQTGNTLLEVSRVLSSAAFRELKLARCKNPIVVQFWREVAAKAGGEAALANIVPYITSKFDVFLANDVMRPIIAQEKSAFNFREIMDERKILLVNLSKGRLGDINAHLIGLILVGKILMAALSRADTNDPSALPPFYLYIDEFQNITTDSIATILSEARKYKLSLTIAHQFIAQLDEKIRDAVFGNVGSMAAFRVGTEDAEKLEPQFAPVFKAQDIVNLENYHAYLRLLINGEPGKPFNVEPVAFQKGDSALALRIKELSYQKYGRDRGDVDAEIMKKYAK